MKLGLCCPLVQNLSNLLFLTIIVAKKHLENFLKSIAFRHEVGLETALWSSPQDSLHLRASYAK